MNNNTKDQKKAKELRTKAEILKLSSKLTASLKIEDKDKRSLTIDAATLAAKAQTFLAGNVLQESALAELHKLREETVETKKSWMI